MAKRVVEEKISLTQNTSGVTLTAVAAAAALSETISYTVPDRSQIIFNPTDFVYLYLANATPAEIADGSRIAVEITDPMGRRSRVLMDSIYAAFKTLDDATKKAYFGMRVVVPADFLIKVKAAPVTNAIVTASDKFVISCTLVYETLD